ncbi:MAG: hypothetical protein KZQ96_21090 [Candidatus Thiodiazotropha sp. (ex Lucinoma borealis)]|nr:hypothetical protein [Candidatus Thiodiazotropha sp. (ex Lucinoma borealis)]
MDEKHKARLLNLVHLHNEFSKAYKVVEPIVEKMDVTTLNDVRYALRAIVDCLEIVVTDKDLDKFEEAASAAELALRIAWHDVVDITFDSFRIYLDDLGKTFGPDIAARYIDMHACGDLLTLFDGLVSESRGDRSKRVELYSQITNDHLSQLKKLFNDAKISEAAIAAAYKKEKRENALKIFGALISLVILSTIIYVNFFKASNEKSLHDTQIEHPGENNTESNGNSSKSGEK